VSLANGNKLFGCATAAAAIGLLITPAPAQARPDSECYSSAAGYQFPGGEVVIVYPETDAETHFNAPRGTHVDAPAETFYKNGTSLKGRITGDITKGGNIIRLTVTRGPKYPPLILDGAVVQNNTAAGSFAFENNDRQLWESPTQLACVPGAPVEDQPLKPAGPKPAQEPLQQQNPAPQGLGNATVVADTDIYDKPDGKGQKIGTLFTGEVHPLMEPCRNDWCRVGQLELGGFPGLPNGTAWVYAKGYLTFSK
jgi:hypothetical protein